MSLKAAGVQFTSPVEDEQLKEGQTYRVKWNVPTSANNEQVEIAITNPYFESSSEPVSWSNRFYVVYNAFSIADVSGLKSVYTPGESISVSLSGAEADNSPTTPDGGFITWADEIPNGARNVNGVYDSATKSWKLDLSAPSSAASFPGTKTFLLFFNAFTAASVRRSASPGPRPTPANMRHRRR